MAGINNNNNFSENTSSYRCRLCGKKYQSLGDMQRHELVVHVQKGDVPLEN
ncbi:MAG TPA: hypothetical protein VE548_15760 [Nitrososphaeraceae archaeon]|nr:hypothetical protein [Nitrososphaeraceae archaeon]